MDKTQVYIHTVHKQTYGISSMEEMLKKKMSKAIGGDSKKKKKRLRNSIVNC